MRSPVVAMLWENWRLTQMEAAQRLVQGIVLAAAVLVGVGALGTVGDGTARLALSLLVMTYAPLWLSVAKLNGGRFMDGYRPGYPFYFLFARPVRTFVLVGAPMAYNVALAVAAYLVSALALRAIFGYPFPLLPLAASIAVFHMAQWAAQWGTSNKVVQWVGSLVAGGGFAALAVWRARDWPARFDFSIGDYALLASVSLVAFGLAVVGVERQRRGDVRAALPRAVGGGAFADWLAGLSRFRCPIASATRAQVWFELKSSGLPVLTIGGALAIVIPNLFAIGGFIDGLFSGLYVRAVAVLVALFSLPALLLLGGNAFGIRARQGVPYAALFQSTQAFGTARMAGLKVLVRSACLLVALVAVGASVWTSASVIPFDVLDDNDTFIQKSRSPLSGHMRALEAAVRAMSAYELLALAFVIVIVVTVMVALRAALPALRARYSRRVTLAAWALLVHAGALVLLMLAGGRGMVSDHVVMAVLIASKWGAAAAIVLATIYLARRTFVERLLTLRPACIAALVAVAFGAAWLAVLQVAGVQLGGMPTTEAAWRLSPILLPPLAAVLAPWSLSRARHL